MSMRNGTRNALRAAALVAAALAGSGAVRAQMQGPGHAPGAQSQELRQAPAPSHAAPAMPAPQHGGIAPNAPMPAPNRAAPPMPRAAPPMSGAAPPMQQRAIGPHTPPAVGPRIMPAPHVPTPQMGAAGGAGPGANAAPRPPDREPAPREPHPQPGVAPSVTAPQPGVAPRATAPQPGMAPRAAVPPARTRAPWHGDIGRFQEHDVRVWRSGHWHHGPHDGRHGWWWVVGGAWYFYPAPSYPYPDPFVPGFADAPPDDTGYWYYCPYWDQYYPYVATCPGGWQPVPAEQ